MKMTDLADGDGAGAAASSIVGIRPGEKLHEVMITEDDARTTVELDDRYVIEPAFARLAPATRRPASAQPVAEGFRYASDTNAEWLDGRRAARPARDRLPLSRR